MLFNLSNQSDLVEHTTSGTTQRIDNKPLVIEVLAQVYLIALPVICVTGVIGNGLAFFVFISKPMRRTSCSLYLAARSITDGGFLTTTFITWSSDASRTRYFHTDGLCQVTIFLSYVFAFLSVWLTVVITCENYIRICRPFSVSNFCNVAIARRCILVLILIAVLMYNYPLWTNGIHVVRHANNMTFTFCQAYSQFNGLVKWLSFWDFLITLIIPSFIIIFLMVAITISLVKSIQRQSRLQSASASGNRGQPADHNGNAPSNNRAHRSSSSPQAKVTRMLFAVSLLFIILNSPSHIIRTKIVILDLHGGSQETQQPSTEQLYQVAFQVIYYMSFGVNLLVYLICGDNFRKVFQERYISLCLRSSRRFQPEMTALTTVRLEEMDRRNDDQTALIPDKGNNSADGESPARGPNSQQNDGNADLEARDMGVSSNGR